MCRMIRIKKKNKIVSSSYTKRIKSKESKTVLIEKSVCKRKEGSSHPSSSPPRSFLLFQQSCLAHLGSCVFFHLFLPSLFLLLSSSSFLSLLQFSIFTFLLSSTLLLNFRTSPPSSLLACQETCNVPIDVGLIDHIPPPPRILQTESRLILDFTLFYS